MCVCVYVPITIMIDSHDVIRNCDVFFRYDVFSGQNQKFGKS